MRAQPQENPSWRSDGGVSETVAVTTASTGWVQITNAYPAVGTGNTVGFYVYSSNSPAHQGFHADLLSLSSPASP